MNNSILPEWELPRIALVWPEWFKNRTILTEFYEYLITEPLNSIPVVLIVKSNEVSDTLKRVIASQKNLSILHIPEVTDIWVRDWGPLRSNTRMIKAIYSPAYLAQYKHEAESDNSAGIKLAQHVTPPVVNLGLILDCGNFIHNGAGTAIMTERVLRDNGHRQEEEIRAMFRNICGIERCVFAEEEPGDETGHIDGTARFLDEKTIAVGTYRPNDTELRDAADRIAESITLSLPDYTIVRVPHGPVRYSEGKEGMPSARGNHMNFLRHKNTIFVPCYGDKEDDQALRILSDAVPWANVKPVRHRLLNELSRFGGVLNCISCNV